NRAGGVNGSRASGENCVSLTTWASRCVGCPFRETFVASSHIHSVATERRAGLCRAQDDRNEGSGSLPALADPPIAGGRIRLCGACFQCGGRPAAVRRLVRIAGPVRLWL